MSEVTLRRGKARVSDLTKALNKLGVEPGDDFTISPAENGDMDRLSFVGSSETSRKAAIDNAPRRETQRWHVLQALSIRDMTREEIENHLGLLGSSVRPRVVELAQGGFVEATSGVRRTHTGNEAEILTLTPKGWDAVE